MKKIVALAFALMVLPLPAAEAGPSPYGPVHIERQRGSTLVIEHTPVRRRVVRRVAGAKVSVARRRVQPGRAAARRTVRRTRIVARRSEFVRHPAIAGGCREGGLVRRRVAGHGVVPLQREVCVGIAPVSSLPRGMAYVPQFIDLRPLVPADPAPRRAGQVRRSGRTR